MKQKLIRFDWALKKLLRDKANFDILEGFLSELLKEDIKIQSILESESNKRSGDDKFNRVDLLVENNEKELIIIEIQNTREIDYIQRILYGTSKLLIENMREGMPYSMIRKIISISIVYFDLGRGKDYVYKGGTFFIGLHDNDELELNEEQKKLYHRDKISNIYPEYYILRINNFDDKAKDKLDEWIYFLKNEEIKEEFRAKGLEKAKKELDIMNLNEDEKHEYENYQEYLHYEASMWESTYISGELKGREKGREEGIKKGREEGVRKGREEGVRKGREEGIMEGQDKERKASIMKLHKKGLSIHQISDLSL
jgi:predicted transposase/invertase (TIGR01784 family)